MRIIYTIHDLRLGDEVRSTIDGAIGTVVDTDGAAIKVRWSDNEHSIFSRRNGFVLFTPITEGEVK